MTLPRRDFLLHLLGLSAVGWSTFTNSSACAAPRTPYGGTLRIALPLPLSSLDPSDPLDMSSALLGSALFESLYARTATGQIYPTLAESLPTEKNQRTHVQLRPGLLDAAEKPLTSDTVLQCFELVQQKQPALAPWSQLRREGTLGFSATGISPQELAEQLASPAWALSGAPRSGTEREATGAFRIQSKRQGSLVLRRNPTAPRGGAFLDSIELSTQSLADCLRSFEAQTSDLGWLGRGYHQARAHSTSFQLAALGTVVLLNGRARPLAPGVLESALRAVPPAVLHSLGFKRSAAPSGSSFRPPIQSILCPADSPQLLQTAHTLAELWSRPQQPIRVLPETRAELGQRKKSGDYEVMLEFVRSYPESPRALHLTLLTLQGEPLPRRFTPETPEQLARRYSFGVVGAWAPHGALDESIQGLISQEALHLGQAHLSRSHSTPRR